MKKLFFILPVLLLVAAACGAPKTAKPTEQTTTPVAFTPTSTPSSAKPSVTPKPSPTKQPAKIASPKTYVDATYGFSFEYPSKTLEIKNCGPTSLKYSGLKYIKCFYAIPPSDLAPSHDGLLAIFDTDLSTTLKSLGFVGAVLGADIDGQPWDILASNDGPNQYLTEKNGKTYWFIYAPTIPNSDFENIIKTFKFK